MAEKIQTFINDVRDDVTRGALQAIFEALDVEVNALRTAVNEMITDHATIVTELTAIGTTLANIKTIYDAHTHECPGSSYAASRCSTPDTGAAENSLVASEASAITDTSGSSVPATLSAAEVSDSLTT
jgi:prophage DNA circulation protein